MPTCEILIRHAFCGSLSLGRMKIPSKLAPAWFSAAVHRIAHLSVMLIKLKAFDVVARGLLLMGTGSIDGQVFQAARLEGVDLIVMGTRSRSWISRFLKGSLASRVIARAHCPVLVIRGQSVNKNTSQGIPSMSCQKETELFT